MSLQTVISSIESFFSTIGADIKKIFAAAEAEEDKLIPEIEAAVNQIDTLLESPGAVAVENLIPDGSSIAGLIEQVGADILAACTFIQGLTYSAASSTTAPTLNNPDAVVKTAAQVLANATPTQVQAVKVSYGNILLQKASPSGGDISYGTANLTRALYAKVKTTA